MAREKKEIEEEIPPGAPDWMVTFSDCMTLLLTFFVLLLSFASFEPETLPMLGKSFAEALPSVGKSKKTESDTMKKKESSTMVTRTTMGTETRPPVENVQTDVPLAEKKPLDFRNVKVFTIESDKFFWGNAIAISETGREILKAMAKFLKSRPTRVVISEHGPQPDQLGLERTWAVMQYLVQQEGISEAKISISNRSMLQSSNVSQRIFEITLLEKSIYSND
jgi:chemotaxis protein MotB